MNMEKKTYRRFADAHAPASPSLKNCILAYITGGIICCLGQSLIYLYRDGLGMPERDAGTMCSVSLIFLSTLLSGLGVFDRLAKLAGGGTLVPITGFANAVASTAIDARSEGLVLGVGTKIFSVAGPVILYAVLSGSALGVILWLASLI